MQATNVGEIAAACRRRDADHPKVGADANRGKLAFYPVQKSFASGFLPAMRVQSGCVTQSFAALKKRAEAAGKIRHGSAVPFYIAASGALSNGGRECCKYTPVDSNH
ncbi:MAG: hypothetical protein WDZ59_17710 [Pirellulales bacterium]